MGPPRREDSQVSEDHGSSVSSHYLPQGQRIGEGRQGSSQRHGASVERGQPGMRLRKACHEGYSLLPVPKER